HDPGFGERGVDDPRSAELVEKPVRDAEHAAQLADVLAHDEHLRIIGHGTAQTLVEGLGHRQLRHDATSALASRSSAANPARYAPKVVRCSSSPECGSA